ncbi:MAG: hypothetical protein IT310_14760 [Anaerolineales bacterium]|nr:hypothetical protein [Anaerolineales bacterium]
MKFLTRFFTVLAVACVFGFGLYYGIQSLPDDLPGISQGGSNPAEHVLQSAPQQPLAPPARDGRMDEINIGRLLRSMAKNLILISILACFTILAVRVLNKKPLINFRKK